jgi:hypothetical protein
MPTAAPLPAVDSPAANNADLRNRLGKVLLMGSGETSASGRRMHHRLFEALPGPVRVVVLEPPAGFELNSGAVAGRVADFLAERLVNFKPAISVLPARRQDGTYSTNNPEILAPIIDANYIFAGAGSPTYFARHIRGSLAYEYILGRHRQGATLCLASAAVIAISAKTLPVYEIYKAGFDPYWEEGVDFFGDFGLPLAMVSHWDNNEGGDVVDTSHCFAGRARFEPLRRSLPPGMPVLGIDEHTGLLFDFQAERCEVMGRGGVTIVASGSMQVYENGSSFSFSLLGPYHLPVESPVHGTTVNGEQSSSAATPEPGPEVLALIQRRETARQARDWTESDRLRQEIAAAGFEVKDTKEGPQWRYTGQG